MQTLRNVIAGSRYLLIIAVLGTFVAALAVLLYAGFTVVLLIVAIFSQFKFQVEDINLFQIEEIKHVALTSIELIDVFLISTVLYIFSLALYSLFISMTIVSRHWALPSVWYFSPLVLRSQGEGLHSGQIGQMTLKKRKKLSRVPSKRVESKRK
jgi:hypothetical protein